MARLAALESAFGLCSSLRYFDGPALNLASLPLVRHIVASFEDAYGTRIDFQCSIHIKSSSTAAKAAKKQQSKCFSRAAKKLEQKQQISNP